MRIKKTLFPKHLTFFMKTSDTSSDDEGFKDFMEHFTGSGSSEENDNDQSNDDQNSSDANDDNETSTDDDSEDNSEDTDNNESENTDDDSDKDNDDTDTDEDEDENEYDEDDKDSNEDVEDDSIEALKAQNKQLMGMLQKFITNKDASDKDLNKEEIKALHEEAEYKDVIKLFDFDESESRIFSKFINTVIARTEKATINKVMQTTPEVVANVMDNKTRMETLRNEFYAANPALNEVREYVMTIASSVAKENPELDIKKVLTKTAKRAYKALGIKPPSKNSSSKEASSETGKKKKKPAFAKAGGSRKQPKKKSKFETDIEAMLALD